MRLVPIVIQCIPEVCIDSVLQVRALLLDPAVNREFQRVHKALEDKTEEAKRLHEELQGTLFSQESKQGRMLVAKCRTLAVNHLRSPCCHACE